MQWFSVIDLSNAFFSMPVHPVSQFWFAFNFDVKSYTFTHLCQGYCESPTIYYDEFGTPVLTQGAALLQYVDLMIFSPTRDQCEKTQLHY